MMEKFRITIASLPDREHLVAEVLSITPIACGAGSKMAGTDLALFPFEYGVDFRA